MNHPSSGDPDLSDHAEDIVNTLREPLVVLDRQLRVKQASAAFYRVFDVAPDKTVGRLFHELGDGQWDIPGLREKLGDLLRNDKASFDDFSVDHHFPGVGQRTMLLNARRLPPRGEARLILLAIDDITARRRVERRLAEKARLLDLSNDAIIVRDVYNRITYWNRGAEQIFGYTHEEAIGQDQHQLLRTEFEKPFSELIE
ncbi:MAG: PAS domain-containing protein, partial [Acidobacteria bacterium]|nr:PAS domain-containing protein [Acidobacteriota bacterium]